MTPAIEGTTLPPRNSRGGNGPLSLVVALLAFAVTLAPSGTAAAQTVSQDALLTHIRYLSDDALQGREAGDPGADRAAAYLARVMRTVGIEPLGTQGYLQPFEVTTTLEIEPKSRLVLNTRDGARALELYTEWLPFSFSSRGKVNGGAVSAGYGLDEQSYREIERRQGKVVAVLRGGTPDDFDVHGTGIDPSPRYKATIARDHGADAVLIAVSRIRKPGVGEPPIAVGIPAAQIIESDLTLPWLESDDLSVTLDARVKPLRATASNVVGRVPGRDPERSSEVIVVGAHYDHLGLGGPGSLAPDVEAVHNGADDNASGTAVMMELARFFARHPEERPARSLVFVAFSAEEMGLLGSEYFVDNPPVPLENVVAMVNFDMVGRLRDGRLRAFGTGTAGAFRAILDSLAADAPLSLSHTDDGYGPSDQTSFYARGIPVLHLFTGAHSEYHRPEDDWQLINGEGIAQVAEFSVALLRALGDRSDRFEVVERPAPVVQSGRGYGPYLGTVPDFSEIEGGGVRLAGVRAGGPAERAGLQAGDVVIEFAGAPVTNLYDYTYALRAHKPGDTVVIKIRRGDREMEVEAVLERRQ